MATFSYPSIAEPSRILLFDKDKCVGCNVCVNTCSSDVMIPNPEKGGEPVVLFAEECWFCGSCVQECPHKALTLIPTASQRISTIWRRKATGEEFRMGMLDPPEPNTTPPVGRNH